MDTNWGVTQIRTVEMTVSNETGPQRGNTEGAEESSHFRVGKAAEEFLVFELGVAGSFEGSEERDVGADRTVVRWYAHPTFRDLVGEPVVVPL